MAGDRNRVEETKRIDPETFRKHVEYAIENCSGGGVQLYDNYGYPVCPVPIILERLKVPAQWIQLWSNVRSTHTPMKDKLLEFLTPHQHGIVSKIEEIYINSGAVSDAERKAMRKLL